MTAFTCEGGLVFTSPQLALGPTGDIGIGVGCWGPGVSGLGKYGAAAYQRLNGSGTLDSSGSCEGAGGTGADVGVSWQSFAIDTNNDLDVAVAITSTCSPMSSPPYLVGWFGETVEQGGTGIDQTLSSNFCDSLYTGGTCGGWLAPTGQEVSHKYLPGPPDGTGGYYQIGTLLKTLDVGCGPMVPTSSSDGYVAHFDASATCIYSHVLPTVPQLVADGYGAVLSVSSSVTLDLGCGALPAASGGSTFVTRLDPTGACVFGQAPSAPGLSVALDPSGSAVISGTVGGTPVDLGGGPLAPIGTEDIVLGELDVMGNHLWGSRFGGAGVTLPGPTVTVATAGNVYLLTRNWSGTVDFGSGPVTAAKNDTVVASYTPSGAPRWSRDFPIKGSYYGGIDGCGSLVLASLDPKFDAGQGTILVPASPSEDVAIVRYAP